MDPDRIPEPFHAGELLAQRLAGVAAGSPPIRNRMPEQHRAFFPLLRFVCLSVPDEEGWPLATLVEGPPGFASSPDAARLDVAALPARGDPVRGHLAMGAPAGLLGIDLATRRRNRLNGTIAQAGDHGFAVEVGQSFGNCPRYIQVRGLVPVARQARPAIAFDAVLPARARAMLAQSSTLFVASRSGAGIEGAAAGLDISHRGGPPGFARLEGDVLSVPDYAGNRYFNTLGNFMSDPRAAIVLADFASGDVLQLQGLAAVDWDAHALNQMRDQTPDQSPPAERTWRFRIVRGVLREGGVNLAERGA